MDFTLASFNPEEANIDALLASAFANSLSVKYFSVELQKTKEPINL